LLAIDRDLRPLIREALCAATIDWQHLVLSSLDVPHADHGDQPIALLLGKIVGLRKILLEIVEFPALGIELDQLVVIDRRPKRQTGLGERGAGPWAHGPPAVMIEGAMAKHLEILGDMQRRGVSVVE
jgi:hypothetical protein